MTTTDKIKRLYNIPASGNHGFDEKELSALEARLGMAMPGELRHY